MAADFSIKRNDTDPPYRGTVADGNGNPIDLSDVASVKFLMRVVSDTPINDKVSSAASIEDITGGIVSYSWIVGDTDTSGTYIAEIELTKTNGRVETIPNDGYTIIQITDDLG